eukprot:TRINITY_DN15479_c0_g1_i12.p1 TRINITY_DN15479_c0_g1~~TRINITY_DN15479_c0_g1_i12.p1  ORF type:complete len:248 (-),score=96.06 TRINITY_DN15479_c0_g1_i12:34-777(-)
MSSVEVEDNGGGEGASSSKPGLMGAKMTAKEKYAERMKKLRDLHMKRNEARKLNHKEVVEEDRRNKEPKNEEARKRRAEYIIKEEEEKAACLAAGKDWEIEKLRNMSAEDAEALDRRRKGKLNPDEGFSNFEQATFRKYNGLVKQIKPDMEQYERQKDKMGDAFYAGSGSVVQGQHKDSQDAISRMALDVQKQKEKRDKFSRRRRHDPDADIDYINERNMKFNQKLERFYGSYTKEIKDNLERGTAV